MPAVVNLIKGRTKCPKCRHEFVLDISDGEKRHEAVCPNCNNKFSVIVSDSPTETEEGSFWVEHGEPRKTILSSRKQKTRKPKIAAVLLICVFVIGLSTAVYFEIFIESSTYVTSFLGVKGTVDIHVTDKSNNSVYNLTVEIEDFGNLKKTGNGSYVANNVEVGIKEIKIHAPGYVNITQEILVTPFFTSYQDIKMEKGVGSETNSFDLTGCTFILIIFPIFALLAAIASFKRVHFDAAAICSIISIFAFGFFMVGSILSIIAFVIIFKSKEEFDDGKKGKVF